MEQMEKFPFLIPLPALSFFRFIWFFFCCSGWYSMAWPAAHSSEMYGLSNTEFILVKHWCLPMNPSIAAPCEVNIDSRDWVQFSSIKMIAYIWSDELMSKNFLFFSTRIMEEKKKGILGDSALKLPIESSLWLCFIAIQKMALSSSSGLS